MKKILLISIIFYIMLNSTYAEIDITKKYSANEIKTLSLNLANKYPENIELEIIGKSSLGKEIVALRVHSIAKDYTKRYIEDHINVLITGGVHGREPTNPKLIIKQLEYYLEKKLIPKNVSIHAIPMVNPDGYDLSLHGMTSSKGEEILVSIKDKNFSRWKSNINGVDINRNFPDEYYDLKSSQWINQWGRNDRAVFSSDKPSGSFYFGMNPGSEKETETVMDYMKKYYFDGYLDYHSQGRVIYWEKWYLDNQYNNMSKEIAEKIRKNANGYLPVPESNLHGSGYTSHYFTNLYRNKPSLTIETTKTRNLPYLSDQEELEAFDKNKNTTLVLVNYLLANKQYGDYKAYTENYKFYNDFKNKKVALAYAKKYDLKVYEYVGTPKEYFSWYATLLEEIQ